MILPFTIRRGAKAILFLGFLYAGVILQGCVGSVHQNSPEPPPSPISVSVSPASVSLQVSHGQLFTATVQNDVNNKGVSWSLTQSGRACTPGCGSLSGSTTQQVIYNAPASVPSPATVTLTATSLADSTKSASAMITVNAPPVSVSISPSPASVQISQTQQFTATVQNDMQNQGVTWTLSGQGCLNSACGSLSLASLNMITYTAPSAVPSPATVTLIATSVTDNTKSASATITVTPSTTPGPVGVIVKFCDDETGNPDCTAKDTFSLSQIRDLFVWVNWQNVATGTHTQTTDIYDLQVSSSPFAMYQTSFTVVTSPPGSAQTLVVLPVAGTIITQRQLTGTWTVKVSLNSILMDTETFQFTP